MKKVREGYKMTELGEIPSEWEIKSIGEIFDFSGGLSISRKDAGIIRLSFNRKSVSTTLSITSVATVTL